MPLGGSTISWDGQPLGSESVSLGDDRIRSMKTSVQQGIANEHNWPATGGANTGYHLLGSARAHFGTQSVVSSGDTDGRLMIASDSSRLFGVGSGGTVLLGAGPRSLSIDSSVYMTFPQRARWALEVGQTLTDGSGGFTTVFPNSGFSLTPIVFTQATSLNTVGTNIVRILSATASQFTGILANTYNGAGISTTTFDWIAVGYRTL